MRFSNIIFCLSFGMLACGMIDNSQAMKKASTEQLLINKLNGTNLTVVKNTVIKLLEDTQDFTKYETALSVLRKAIATSWYYSNGNNRIVYIIDMLARDGNKAAQYFIDDEVQLGNEYVLTFLDQNGINECYKKNAGIRYALTKFKQSRHAQNVISRDDIRRLAEQANDGNINAIKRLVNMYYKFNNKDAEKVLYDIFEKATKMLNDDDSKQSAIKVITALAVADYHEAIKFLHDQQGILIAFIQEKIDSICDEISDSEFFELRNSISDDGDVVTDDIVKHKFKSITRQRLTALNRFLRKLHLHVKIMDDGSCIVALRKKCIK